MWVWNTERGKWYDIYVEEVEQERKGQRGEIQGCFLPTFLAVFPRLIKPQVAEEMSLSWKPKGKSEQIPFSLFKTCGKFRVSVFKKNFPQECVWTHLSDLNILIFSESNIIIYKMDQ